MEKQNNYRNQAAIIMMIAAVIISFIGGYALKSMFDEGKEKCKTEEKKENNEPVDKNEVVEVEIDDSIRKVHKKYHSTTGDSNDYGKIGLTGLMIESKIYGYEPSYKDKNVFYVKEMSDISSYGKNIYLDAEEELKPYLKIGKEEDRFYYANDVDSIIEKYFNNYFGGVIDFNKGLFEGCNYLYHGYNESNEEVYYYMSACGDMTAVDATYTLTKAEKDDENLYLYETVNITDAGETLPERVYKWSYKLVDGDYHFYKAERIS